MPSYVITNCTYSYVVCVLLMEVSYVLVNLYNKLYKVFSKNEHIAKYGCSPIGYLAHTVVNRY